MMHAYDPSSWETEAGGSGAQSHPLCSIERHCLQS